jgi:phage head maturation protease
MAVPGGDRWTADRSRVERVRALAHHVSVVPFPAYADARIAAVRGEMHPATPLLTLARRWR